MRNSIDAAVRAFFWPLPQGFMYALTSDTNRGYMRSHGMPTGATSALRINARIEATARSRTASGNCRRIQIDPRFPDVVDPTVDSLSSMDMNLMEV